jgi:hypothetical protein
MKVQVFCHMTLLSSKQLPGDILEKHSAFVFRVKHPKKVAFPESMAVLYR